MPNDDALNSKLPLQQRQGRSSARASGWPWWGVFSAFAVLFMLVYSAAILIPYAFSDDYTELAYGLQGTLWQQDMPMFAQGRAAQALLYQATWGIIPNLSDVRLLRMFGIIGLGLLAYLLYRALMSAGASRAVSLIIPALICTMPAYQVYVSWADCAIFTWGASLAGLAALIAEHALRSKRWRSRLFFVIVAAVLEYIAISIYQPAAMVYWVFVAIPLLMSFESVRHTLWRMALMGSVVVLGLGGDFLTSSLANKLFFGPNGLARTQLATNPEDKISWFTHDAL